MCSQHLYESPLRFFVAINVALGGVEALVPRQVLHIPNAATTIRNLSSRIGDERPAAAV
jgi:hypothetical protein